LLAAGISRALSQLLIQLGAFLLALCLLRSQLGEHDGVRFRRRRRDIGGGGNYSRSCF
jgi:hypothetical protein